MLGVSRSRSDATYGIHAVSASWTIGREDDATREHRPPGCMSCLDASRPGGVAQLAPLTSRDRAQRRSRAPVGFQNSAVGSDLGFYAARSYSLTRPPRTGRRWIRFRERSATG